MYAIILWQKGESNIPMHRRRVYMYSDNNWSAAEIYETLEDAEIALKDIRDPHAETESEYDPEEHDYAIISLAKV